MEFTDDFNDTLRVSMWGEGGALLRTITRDGRTASVAMPRAAVLALYEALGDHLAATALDDPETGTCDEATCCVQPAPTEHRLPLDGEPRTILEDAQAAVYGDRQQDYGHPREDFTRTAIIWTGLLHHKLADGVHLEPEDIARCQIGVKLARDVHAPKRDNRVDMAGYALTLDRLETGR